MVIGVYAYESDDKELFSVGSVVGFPLALFEAERQWEKALAKNEIAYFRSYDAENLKGEFDIKKHGGLNAARAVSESAFHDLLPILTSDLGVGGISISLALNDYWELLSENAEAPAYFGTDPLILGYTQLIKTVIYLFNQDVPAAAGLLFSFTFDRHSNRRLDFPVGPILPFLCPDQSFKVFEAGDGLSPTIEGVELLSECPKRKTRSEGMRLVNRVDF